MQVDGQLSDMTGINWRGGWVGHKAGLDATEKRKIVYSCRETNANSSVI
jgi:hypothetical protein